MPDGRTHLGSRVSRVVIGEVDLAEATFAEQLFRNPHLVLRDLNLVKIALPPCPASSASFRLRFRLDKGERSLATIRKTPSVRRGNYGKEHVFKSIERIVVEGLLKMLREVEWCIGIEVSASGANIPPLQLRVGLGWSMH